MHAPHQSATELLYRHPSMQNKQDVLSKHNTCTISVCYFNCCYHPFTILFHTSEHVNCIHVATFSEQYIPHTTVFVCYVDRTLTSSYVRTFMKYSCFLCLVNGTYKSCWLGMWSFSQLIMNVFLAICILFMLTTHHAELHL